MGRPDRRNTFFGDALACEESQRDPEDEAPVRAAPAVEADQWVFALLFGGLGDGPRLVQTQKINDQETRAAMRTRIDA